jgi:hypothetical protein
MKTLILTLILLTALAVGGCKGNSVAQNSFHVTAVSPDSPVDVIGTLGDKEYALSVNRENVPLYIAYYEPIGIDDVGKNFRAILADGTLSVEVPGKGTVRYTVQSVREK